MFSVEIKHDTITDGLVMLSRSMGDMTPVMEEIGEYLVGSTKDRFKAGVSPQGAKWAPKSAATLARYGARKSNRVDVRPLFGPSGMLSSQIHYDANPSQLEVGSPMIYAAVQHFGAAKGQFGTARNGSSIPWGDIPARPFLGVSPADEIEIVSILAQYVQHGFSAGA